MTEKRSADRALALRLMAQFGLAPPAWQFRFNRRKRALGMCFYPTRRQPGRIELSVYFVERNPLETVDDTVRHEIAHALAGEKAGHGPVWKEMCLKVGANPERTACSEGVDMPEGHWQARCPSCGQKYAYHRKPKHPPGSYFCRKCGQEKGALNFAPAV